MSLKTLRHLGAAGAGAALDIRRGFTCRAAADQLGQAGRGRRIADCAGAHHRHSITVIPPPASAQLHGFDIFLPGACCA